MRSAFVAFAAIALVALDARSAGACAFWGAAPLAEFARAAPAKLVVTAPGLHIRDGAWQPQAKSFDGIGPLGNCAGVFVVEPKLSWSTPPPGTASILVVGEWTHTGDPLGYVGWWRVGVSPTGNEFLGMKPTRQWDFATAPEDNEARETTYRFYVFALDDQLPDYEAILDAVIGGGGPGGDALKKMLNGHVLAAGGFSVPLGRIRY